MNAAQDHAASVMKRLDRLRRALAALLIVLTGVALYMSWPALFDAARHVGGMTPERAIAFPVVVDLVTIAAMLLALLVPNPSKRVQGFTWATLGLYGAITILGNASEAAIVDPTRLTLGFVPAVIVNSIPGVSLLVTTHLASINVFRPKAVVDAVAAAPVAPVAMRRPRAVSASTRKGHPSAGREGKRAEVIQLRAEQKSLSEIAIVTGIPKATVSRWLTDAPPAQEQETPTP